MLYSVHLYEKYDKSHFFHFILEVLSIIVLMLNIVKIELINATENCLQNIVFVQTFVCQINYALPVLI